MATANARRRWHGEDAIYFDAATNRYIGAVSLAMRPMEDGSAGRSLGRQSRK